MSAFPSFACALLLFALTAPMAPGAAPVVISTNFPGGNVLVEQNEAGTVNVAPDPRGDTPWFYWHFEATAAQTGRVDFVFPSAVVGMQGPAVSYDGGITWQWMGAGDERVWSGSGTDNNWATADNWDGIVPTDNTNTLIFAGTDRLTNTNNLTPDWRFSSLVFDATAGPFVLNGNRIKAMAVTMGFTNNSPNLQTLNLDLDQTSRASLWTARAGDFVMNGGISSSAGAGAFNMNAPSTVTKDGLGTLTLGGANVFSSPTPGLKILNGKVVLDMNSGGTLSPATLLDFGLGSGSGGDINKQGGTLVIRGRNTGTSALTLGDLRMYESTSIARIQVDPNGGSSTTLTLGTNWSNKTIASDRGFLAIDLSAPGSAVASGPSLVNDIVGGWCIVTDPDGTGFATTNDAGRIVRNLRRYDWTTSSTASNYVTAGTKTLSAVATFGTLTIQAEGALTGNYNAYGGAVLMEEGCGDYTNGCAVFAKDSVWHTYLHQYSTNGNLILNCGLNGYYTKTGPGMVIFRKNSATSVTLRAVEGILDVQAALTGATTRVRVFNGGTLKGSGALGSGTATNTVTIFPGGTLVGTHTATNALTINGALILHDRSTFAVDLAGSPFQPLRVTGTVTNLGANLALTLERAPAWNEEITLLTSDSGMVGSFATVNGAPIDATGRFALTSGSEAYEFRLIASATNVSLQAIAAAGTLIKVL